MFNSTNLSRIENAIHSSGVPDTQVEVEAKFGYYSRRGFNSRVNFRNFDSLRRTLEKSLKSTKEHTRDYRSSTGIRKQIISVPGQEDKVVWQRKTRLTDFDQGQFRDYGVRVSINSEVPIEPVEDFVYDVLRIRNRTTFRFKAMRIDMTEVDPQSYQSGRSDDDRRLLPTYEVEIEIINPKIDTHNKMIQFNQLLKKVYMELYDTELLYTFKERDGLSRYINRILGEKDGPVLQWGMMARARNLKFRDMVWGGLVGGKIVDERVHSTVPNYYTVTHKTDGLRKFLAIDKTGIWLVFPPREANLLYRFTARDQDRSLSGLILDGELVDRDHRKLDTGTRIVDEEDVVGVSIYARESMKRRKEIQKFLGFSSSKYWFLVFDTLAIDRNKSVQRLPHSERMREGYQAVNRMEVDPNPRLLISFKSFRQIASTEEFFEVMQRMFAEKPLLPYEEDGFIFMSEMAPYNPIRRIKNANKRRLRVKERSLVKMPDICKWKPVKRITIDFSIVHRPGGQVELMVLKDRDLAPFKGTRAFPFDSETMVEHDHPLLNPEEYPTGTVIEFEWNFSLEKFVPILARLDKLKPNKDEVAEDDFSDIFNPITEETLQGKNFRLMRKYHNHIKRQLFSGVKEEKFLLDIGSGRGGDVYSWGKFDKIVAVEPNSDHIVELENRLEALGIRDRVRILKAGGENTSKITKAVREFIGGRVDVVSMMFSLTFFWRNEMMLKKLVDSINVNLKDGGEFIFTTMDGDTVEEIYNPFFKGMPLEKVVFIRSSEDRGFATLRLQPESERKRGQGRKAYVYIQDSIVGSTSKSDSKIDSSQGNLKEEREIIRSKKFDLPIIYSPVRTAISKEEIEESEREDEGSSTDTIIVEQEEYLVHLDDFERLLMETGRIIENKAIYRAEQEHFLNSAEKDFSRMFSFGKYTLSKSPGIDLSADYALWKKVNDLSGELEEEYGFEVVQAFKQFNINLAHIFGKLSDIVPTDERFDKTINTFERELNSIGVSKEDISDILELVDLEYPLETVLPLGQIEIEELDLPGVLKIGDGVFYIPPERLNLLLEMKDLDSVAKMVLMNHSSTILPGSTKLPTDFFRKLREISPGDYMIEAETTPLTSVIFRIPGMRKGHYSSHFAEKDFGSFGELSQTNLFENPDITSATIVVLKNGFEAGIETSVQNYVDLITQTPISKNLRIILFIPKSESDVGRTDDIIRSSEMLSYETDLNLSDYDGTEEYHVYILESNKSDVSEIRALFEDFEDFEVDFPNREDIEKYVGDSQVQFL